MNLYMKTFVLKRTEVKRQVHTIDASGQALGRLATQIVRFLRGKHRPDWTPHVDMADLIFIKNAARLRLSGDKLKTKFLFRHSGVLGNAKFIPYEKLMRDKPEEVLVQAVRGMLPKNRMRDKLMRKLRIYRGDIPTTPRPPTAPPAKEVPANG